MKKILIVLGIIVCISLLSAISNSVTPAIPDTTWAQPDTTSGVFNIQDSDIHDETSDSVIATREKFWDLIVNKKYAACDSLIADGFDYKKYTDYFNNQLYIQIDESLLGCDDLFYYNKYTEKQRNEFLAQQESDLIDMVQAFMYFKLKLTDKDKLVQASTYNNFHRLANVIKNLK